MPDMEKRQFPRLTLNVEVDYTIAGTQNPELYTTGSKNVSEGGICVIAFENLECGTIVDLRFELPTLDRFITAKGKIAWMRELIYGNNQSCGMYDAGIEFLEINTDDRKKINDYIISKVASTNTSSP